MYKSRERRLKREKTFILKEFNFRVNKFIEDLIPTLKIIEDSKNRIQTFYDNKSIIWQIILLNDEKWQKYVENKKLDPKYHITPKDNNMFLDHSNFIVIKFMLQICGMSIQEIKLYYPKDDCEEDFITEFEKTICERYHPKEKKIYNITEIQKRNFFYAILNLVNWFVSLVKRK
jgi:hypothetical protein